MSALPASAGWTWFKEGVQLFKRQPGGLATLLFANILISLALSAIPVIGSVLAVVLIPSFSIAVMQACLLTEQGVRVTPAVLLTGFRQPVLGALCKIGVVYLGVSLLLAGVAELAIDDEFWKQLMAPVDPKVGPQVDPGDLMTMMLIALAQSLAMLLLSFTPALTYWQKMPTFKATFYSVAAVLRAARAFVVMLASWFGIFLGLCMLCVLIFGNAGIGRAVIMWIISLFVLLLQCAIYASYRQIFGTPGVDTTA
jgi:hypothetical protein